MFISRLAGLFRHHLANDLSRAANTVAIVNGSLSESKAQQQPASSTTNAGENALDYRCYPQPKVEPHSDVRHFFVFG